MSQRTIHRIVDVVTWSGNDAIGAHGLTIPTGASVWMQTTVVARLTSIGGTFASVHAFNAHNFGGTVVVSGGWPVLSEFGDTLSGGSTYSTSTVGTTVFPTVHNVTDGGTVAEVMFDTIWWVN